MTRLTKEYLESERDKLLNAIAYSKIPSQMGAAKAKLARVEVKLAELTEVGK